MILLPMRLLTAKDYAPLVILSAARVDFAQYCRFLAGKRFPPPGGNRHIIIL
jgi:hypothetical protein